MLKPVIYTNSNMSNLNQINDMVRSLNKEQQVKVFKGSTGKSALVVGKYADGSYGTAYYDVDGNLVSKSDGKQTIFYDSSDARILIGQAPIDGRIGIWISKEGIDVIDELSA